MHTHNDANTTDLWEVRTVSCEPRHSRAGADAERAKSLARSPYGRRLSLITS